MQLLFPNIKKLASVLICGSSPAYESAVSWVPIFFFVSYMWAFTVFPFESLTSATYRFSLASLKSLIVAKVVITESCIHFYRAEQKSQSKIKKDTLTAFSSICTVIEIMGA